MVRDYTKWDDTPISLPHFAESAVRAYKIAMTLPMMPVVLVADSELQEQPVAERRRVAHSETDPATPRRKEIPARWPKRPGCWSAAENPVIIAGRVARYGGRRSAPRGICRNAAGAGDRSGRESCPRAIR